MLAGGEWVFSIFLALCFRSIGLQVWRRQQCESQRMDLQFGLFRAAVMVMVREGGRRGEGGGRGGSWVVDSMCGPGHDGDDKGRPQRQPARPTVEAGSAETDVCLCPKEDPKPAPSGLTYGKERAQPLKAIMEACQWIL